ASAAVVVAAACGGSNVNPCSDGPPCALDCGPAVDAPPKQTAQHIAEPTPIMYTANPPASGPHWPMWQEPWGPYPDGLPRERWVHNLEHGGIVLAYNCPSGCADVVGELTTIRDATPPDRFNLQRFLIVPDAQMPHRVAAIAWGWRWQAEAVDMSGIRCFVNARYDRAPESIP
ncbi:MAG TPA: DUF3105 domain-containing protein, partial [Polyangia bacterium]